MVDVEWDDDVYLPVYRDINESEADVKLYWGGRDSGKSYNIALKLLEKCLTARKFKCILIRKTFESIRESQWELLRSIVHDNGMDDLFAFTKAPLEVKCVNGNGFIARGCDNPHNIKSVTNPTDAWYEEADKLNFADYSVVSTSLRSNDVKVQEWVSFNPESEGNFEDHWLFKMVGEEYNGTVEWNENIEVAGINIDVSYISCHTTFNDNEYCPPERKAKNMATTEGDDYLYNVYIHGRWGNREVKSPFLTQYDEKKHVAPTQLNIQAQAYVLIDFNITPFSASIFNVWFDGVPHCHQVKEIEINDGTTAKMAAEIKAILGDAIYSTQYGGDFMGSQGRIGKTDNKSLFKELQIELGVSWNQFKIVPNPRHKSSANDCNYFLVHYPDFKVGEHCVNSRRDYRTVQIDAYGSIIKRNRKDESQKADHLDNLRYLVNTFFRTQIDNHKKSGKWF